MNKKLCFPTIFYTTIIIAAIANRIGEGSKIRLNQTKIENKDTP
jgi:hypothetical protein